MKIQLTGPDAEDMLMMEKSWSALVRDAERRHAHLMSEIAKEIDREIMRCFGAKG